MDGVVWVIGPGRGGGRGAFGVFLLVESAQWRDSCEGRERTWIESMSTENTRAPSFARRAASGRPTTSDLFIHSDVRQRRYTARREGRTYRLITVTVFPYARSP